MIEAAKRLCIETSSGRDWSHDFGHSERVVENCKAIMHSEKVSPDSGTRDLIITLAWLHDICDKKYQVSTDLLVGFAEKNIGAVPANKIVAMIKRISWSGGGEVDTVLSPFEAFMSDVVQDADRIDALGAIGIARALVYAGKTGETITDTIKHSRVKLVKLRASMKTDGGRKLAEARSDYLKKYFNDLEAELTSSSPSL